MSIWLSLGLAVQVWRNRGSVKSRIDQRRPISGLVTRTIRVDSDCLDYCQLRSPLDTGDRPSLERSNGSRRGHATHFQADQI